MGHLLLTTSMSPLLVGFKSFYEVKNLSRRYATLIEQTNQYVLFATSDVEYLSVYI